MRVAKRTKHEREIVMTPDQWARFQEAVKQRASYHGEHAGTAVLTEDGPDALEREDVRITWALNAPYGPQQDVRLKLEWLE